MADLLRHLGSAGTQRLQRLGGRRDAGALQPVGARNSPKHLAQGAAHSPVVTPTWAARIDAAAGSRRRAPRPRWRASAAATSVAVRWARRRAALDLLALVGRVDGEDAVEAAGR